MDRDRGVDFTRALIAAALAGLVALSGPAAARDASPQGAARLDRWSTHIAEASARFGIPADWIRRVMRAESGGRTMLDGRPITSRAGAMGLMQLMPATWRQMRTAHGLGSDPHAPRDNILAGAAYLRAMYDRFGYPGLFAAYNAGPARYARHLATGARLPTETVAYAAAVGAPLGARGSTASAQGSDVLAARPAAPLLANASSPGEPAPPNSGHSLFVRLRTVPGTAVP